MSRKLKPKEFIKKAQEVHGDQYDYSEIIYVYASEKVTITCKKHGKFKQSPSKHLNGQGCRKCGIERRGRNSRLSKSDFIEKAKKIHGDKYNCDKVIYKNNQTKVIITCPVHSDFEQSPANHTHKTSPQGCPACGGKTKWDLNRFIEESTNIHRDRYGYSKVIWNGVNKKVKILCPKHGEFLQKPAHHIYREQGCPDCAGTKKGTKEKFIEKARKIHGNKYNYDKVFYKTTHEKVFITCPIHGDFEQSPANHTHKTSPQGCYECSGRKKWTKTIFIGEAKKIHMEDYDYSKVIWSGLKKEVEIVCPFHGSFKQLPIVHLQGSGCQKCSSSRGETKIRLILTKKKVNFEEQYRFEDCSDKNPLPFDFLLMVNDKKAVVEYNGKQHYEPIGFGNKDKNEVMKQFEALKSRDNIKVDWCRENKIPMLVIPFSDHDKIESLLDSFILKWLMN